MFARHIANTYHYIDTKLVYSTPIDHYERDFRKTLAKKLKLSNKLLFKLAMSNCVPKREKGGGQSESVEGLKEEYKRRVGEFE